MGVSVFTGTAAVFSKVLQGGGQKRLIGVIAALVVLVGAVRDADAFLYSYGGEKVNIVKRDAFTDSEDGEKLHLGVIFKQFSIMFIPLWNYDKRFCFVTDESYRENMYADLWDISVSEHNDAVMTEEDVLKAGYGLDAGLWNSIGGKLVLVMLLWGYAMYAKKKIERDRAAKEVAESVGVENDVIEEGEAEDDSGNEDADDAVT